MKTLITGARGFIGQNLVEHLRREHPEESVVLLDREGSDPQTIACDLEDHKRTVSVVQDLKPDRVFHLAGTSRVSGDIDFPRYFLSNFLTTQNLLEGIGDRPCTFFLASSVHVYGSQDSEVTETSPVHPSSPYAYTKYLAEQKVGEQVRSRSSLRAVVGRLYSCIGPGQRPGFVAADLCRRVAALKPGEALETGPLSAYRRFLDVRDLVGILDRLTRETQGPRYDVVNVASPHEMKIAAMLDAILKVAGVQPKVESTVETGNTFRGLQLSTAHLESRVPDLKFRPIEVTLQDMYRAELARSGDGPVT